MSNFALLYGQCIWGQYQKAQRLLEQRVDNKKAIDILGLESIILNATFKNDDYKLMKLLLVNR